LKEIYDILGEFKTRRGERFALATLVSAEGSSYRRPGARMLICTNGKAVGSLSAGCLEEEVVLRACEVLHTGEPTIMTFDTRRRFGCAGKIDIFIERVSEKFLTDLAAHLDARRSCLAVTTFKGSSVGEAGSFPSQNEIVCENWEANGFPYSPFMQEIHPPIRLLIFGDGPDNAPIRKLTELLGWETIEIVDPNAISIETDEWTAAIVKSHNYGRDFVALQRLLPLNLRYVGLIGPPKRRDQLLADLLDIGIAITAGFFAPAGIDLGAETPEEISLAIVSEIQRVFARGSGESLRERKMSIHGTTARTGGHAELDGLKPSSL
jgi:xanthine dehydrogenase accessory factor